MSNVFTKESMVMASAAVGLVVAISLAGTWLSWVVYKFLLGLVWTGGPQSIVDPGFWVFAAVWLPLCIAAKAVKGKIGDD